ncbi:MAG: adenine phosphoribosyltransferase [Deltaproteobacteria bacterium]|nr:adenine phosphoribosyltransferase [Deltaproteobacteria bacterium]
MTDLSTAVGAALRDVPDFPKPGIVFKDITPLLADPELFGRVIAWMAALGRAAGVTKVVALDARGFLFGGALVTELGVGLVPVRKAGKLPSESIKVSYALEYGEAEVELHVDAIAPGERVMVVDDVLATGGTAGAAIALVRALGGEVALAVFVIELGFLEGADLLGVPVESLVVL